MQYVGIDWAYARAAWCAKESGGEIAEEGRFRPFETGAQRFRQPQAHGPAAGLGNHQRQRARPESLAARTISTGCNRATC